MLRGLDPRRHMLLERENPRTLFGINLAQLGVAFWHDLAAPIIAGIIASLIVNWLRNRK